MSAPHLVVNSPPNQDSELARCLGVEPRLGDMLANLARWVAYRDALTHSIADIRAELAALRKLSPPDNCLHGLRKKWCATCKEFAPYPQEVSAWTVYLKTKPAQPDLPPQPSVSDTLPPESFAGRNDVEISYEDEAELKGDKPAIFRKVYLDRDLPDTATLKRSPMALEELLCWKRGYEQPRQFAADRCARQECSDLPLYLLGETFRRKLRAQKVEENRAVIVRLRDKNTQAPLRHLLVEDRLIRMIDAARPQKQKEKPRKALHLAAKQAEMRARAKVRARGKARRRKKYRVH